MSLEVGLDNRRGKEAVLTSCHFAVSTSWVSIVEVMLVRQPIAVFGKAVISLSFDSLQVLCQKQNRPQQGKITWCCFVHFGRNTNVDLSKLFDLDDFKGKEKVIVASFCETLSSILTLFFSLFQFYF